MARDKLMVEIYFRYLPPQTPSSQLMYVFNPNQLNQGDDVIINQWEWWSDDRMTFHMIHFALALNLWRFDTKIERYTYFDQKDEHDSGYMFLIPFCKIWTWHFISFNLLFYNGNNWRKAPFDSEDFFPNSLNIKSYLHFKEKQIWIINAFYFASSTCWNLTQFFHHNPTEIRLIGICFRAYATKFFQGGADCVHYTTAVCSLDFLELPPVLQLAHKEI